jgi:hypothetical protein
MELLDTDLRLLKGFSTVAGAPAESLDPQAILMGGGQIVALLYDEAQVSPLGFHSAPTCFVLLK